MCDLVIEIMQDMASKINKSEREPFPITEITKRELRLLYRREIAARRSTVACPSRSLGKSQQCSRITLRRNVEMVRPWEYLWGMEIIRVWVKISFMDSRKTCVSEYYTLTFC